MTSLKISFFPSQQLLKVSEHKDPVTALAWNSSSEKVYSGDEQGTLISTFIGEKVWTDLPTFLFFSISFFFSHLLFSIAEGPLEGF